MSAIVLGSPLVTLGACLKFVKQLGHSCADAKLDIHYVHGAKCIEDVSKDLEAYLQTS